MQFNQFSVMCSKAPEWNFSIETEKKTQKEIIRLCFFLSILNRNIEVYYTQMDKRKTHRTLDCTSGLWISTKFANLVKKTYIYR